MDGMNGSIVPEASLPVFRADVSSSLSLPLAGAPVRAGFPSPAEDFDEGSIDLNRFLVSSPASTFYLRVSGRSMERAGILDGDYVVVDRSRRAAEGDVVVAVLDGEFTLKRLQRRGKRWALCAEGGQFGDIEVDDEAASGIWGVVTGSFRRLCR